MVPGYANMGSLRKICTEPRIEMKLGFLRLHDIDSSSIIQPTVY